MSRASPPTVLLPGGGGDAAIGALRSLRQAGFKGRIISTDANPLSSGLYLADSHQVLPEIKDLNNPKFFPYRWGQAVWAYIGGRWGDEVIGQLLLTAAATGDIDAAFEHVLGVKTKEFSAQWHAAIQQTYANTLADASRPEEMGNLLITGKGIGEELNVGPAISPDGKWIAFLSTRSLFSIQLPDQTATTAPEIARRYASDG